MEIGKVDRLVLRVYDLAGTLIHEATLDHSPGIGINGKQAYEYTWDTGGTASGTYLYVVQVTHQGNTIQTLKKLAIAK